MKRENRKAMTAKRSADMHAELHRLNTERAGMLAERNAAVANANHTEKEYSKLQEKLHMLTGGPA